MKKYTDANDTLHVSVERKAELASLMRSSLHGIQRTRRRAAGCAAAVFAAVVCVLAVHVPLKNVHLSNIANHELREMEGNEGFSLFSETENGEAVTDGHDSVTNYGWVYSDSQAQEGSAEGENTAETSVQLPEKAAEPMLFGGLACPRFVPVFSGIVGTDCLPSFVLSALAVPPEEYVAVNNSFRGAYSENLQEFFISEKEYRSTKDGSALMLSVMRGKNYSERDIMSLTSSKIAADGRELYLLGKDGGRTFEALYAVNDTLFSITGKNMSRSAFVGLLDKCF